ncbi:MAG: prolyl oligopeptidase family serine peptidase [Cardiobacteriaceae bacterium]|nr:prolyl oligopeptidase family serine peptidase [Cardiobacteriaceae bacterium]
MIVWLHGNGEGGVGEYQNNLSPMLANRGVVAWAEESTQAIFGSAYVLAPQVPDSWYFNVKQQYLSKLKALIDEITKQYPIDESRIYLVSASAGGYMAIRMAIEYPHVFATIHASAPALDKAAIAGGVATTAEELHALSNKALCLAI